MIVDIQSRSLLAGRKGRGRHSERTQHRLRLRPHVSRLRGRSAVTWINEKTRGYVEPLARELAAPITMPLDVDKPGEMEAVFDAIRGRWGRLDFLLHSIAFAAPQDLHGRVTDTSQDGFRRAMDISCHSFIRMARMAEPLMDNGETLLTMTYLGANQVVPNYGVMGPVKAALEASVRYLATEFGPRGIRVTRSRRDRSRPVRRLAFPSSTSFSSRRVAAHR